MQLVRIEKLFVAEMPLVPEPHQLKPAEKRRACLVCQSADKANDFFGLPVQQHLGRVS
jgi:hypothetical protein